MGDKVGIQGSKIWRALPKKTKLVFYSISMTTALCSNESRGGTPHIPSPEWADLATFPTKSVSALWWLISDVRLILSAILRPWRVMWGGPLGLLGCSVLIVSSIPYLLQIFLPKDNGSSIATCYLSGESWNHGKKQTIIYQKR